MFDVTFGRYECETTSQILIARIPVNVAKKSERIWFSVNWSPKLFELKFLLRRRFASSLYSCRGRNPRGTTGASGKCVFFYFVTIFLSTRYMAKMCSYPRIKINSHLCQTLWYADQKVLQNLKQHTQQTICHP